MTRALFLDRDGTLIEEVGYLDHPDRIRLFPWTPEALRMAAGAGWKNILITNQAGVARGYFPLGRVETVHAELRRLLAAAGADLDGIYFCPHHPEGTVPEFARACECRKPKPGLLLRAAAEHGLDLRQCWVIGDRMPDTLAARAAGARAVLVLTGYGRQEAEALAQHEELAGTHMAENLLQAVEWILAQGDRQP